MDYKFDELITRLQTAQGANLVSVIAYGTAIAAPDNAQRSDLQMLIVTQRLAATDLRQMRAVINWWTDQGYPLPAFFTAKEFQDSLDVFPIEFRQMKRAYRLLHGRELLATSEASPANLRLQIEYELRGKLLRLRSLALPAGATSHDLMRLMTQSIVSFVRFMRPILELLGEEPPLGRLATVKRIEERLQLDTAPLVRILQLRDAPKELLEVEVQDLFASYLDCLAQVIEAVDKM